MIRACVLLLLTGTLAGCSPEAPPVTEEPPASTSLEAVRSDPRVRVLLYECAREEYFGEDTSHLIPALVSKLVRGQRDPLRCARRDLALEGEAAIGELARLVESQLARATSADVLLNVLNTLALMEPPTGREIAWRLLDHPSETVRIAALRALRGRLQPDDFDRLITFLPGASFQLEAACIGPLYECDPRRLLESLLAWVPGEEHVRVWPHCSRFIAGGPDQFDGVRRLLELLEETEAPGVPEVRAQLLGHLARGGDEAAIEALRGLRDSGVSTQQYSAVEALSAAGLAGELRSILRSNPDEKLRVLAAEAIGSLPEDKVLRDALTLGLSDEEESVRRICLTKLLELGDESALDFAFTLIESSGTDRQVALDALAKPLASTPELASEVLAVLVKRIESERDLPLSRHASYYQTIGQLPSGAAAQFLLEEADRAEGDIDGMNARSWLLLQAGNTGRRGRSVIAAAWRDETDPIRRLDCLAAFYANQGDGVRAILSEAVLREDVTPHEVLVAADFLSRIGPARECAPLLKRVALRCDEAEVRRALQCLLWRFYGREEV